jgi:tetratricopeptide (TPR) repeat protein
MGDRSFDQHGDGEDRMSLSLFSDSTQHPWRNYSNLGLLHQQMGQSDLAIFWFEKALESEPNSQVVRVALAQTLEAAGRAQDALYHLKHVAAAQGRDVQRWLLDALKRLNPPDVDDEPEEESRPKSRDSRPSRSRPSAEAHSQPSQRSSSARKDMSHRRMTMVDKITVGMKLTQPAHHSLRCCMLTPRPGRRRDRHEGVQHRLQTRGSAKYAESGA